MLDKEAIVDISLDKLAMESSAYDELEINFPAEAFPSNLDSLVVRNLPGHFHNVNWAIIPSKTQISDESRNENLEIAVTPYGNADAPVGKQFAKPHLIKEPLVYLLDKLENPDAKQYYFQSQDDNLQSMDCSIPKFLPLKNDSSYLGSQQAANLWIGTKGTTSRLHSDNYDNIYIQVSGTKRIYSLPPCSISDAKEEMSSPATYDKDMRLVPDSEGSLPVSFPTYDPSSDPSKRNLFIVDSKPGDILFLPALWYHQVEIRTSDLNISSNYWHAPFDDERRWSAWNMTRQLTQSIKC